MSDYDEYFDSIDEEALAELRDFEANHETTSPTKAPQPANASKKPQSSEDDSDLFEFSVDNAELAQLEEAAIRQQNSPAKASTSNGFTRTASTSRQTNLHGGFAATQEPVRQPQSRPAFGQKMNKTKVWDSTAFAKTGWRSTKPPKNAKGKGKKRADEEELNEEEYVDLEGLATPFMPLNPITKMKLEPDELTMKDWIFPLNNPKRDYQFNIVKHSLFDNCLVAIPTGVGKTFIAGCVMLNFYRWFPDGKIIFVAPTKPLVAQQIEACHHSCGIPGTDAIELTGEISRDVRSVHWRKKRVFYMTPQTLVNDLASGNCDASKIVLLVIDEAHKGTGDYAYAQVVRFMMSANPFFRLLALTATPGSNREAVQTIVDSLHISHIEIRNEGSMDVQPYLHKKVTNRNIISIQGDMLKIQAPLVRLMDKYLKPLRAAGVIYATDPLKVKAFTCQKSYDKVQQQRYLMGPLKNLGDLARVAAYLLEFSVQMAYNSLKDLGEGKKKGKKKEEAKETPNKLSQEPDYIACIREIERQQAIKKTFPRHPKMEKLRELAIQHFAGAEMEEEAKAKPGEEPAISTTKMIVFCTYRECVEEIVEMLDEQKPMIRAHKFIGQGSDKRGGKGVTQKQQISIIKDFKAGEYNVLVSTSIGEEGLDIGEVDVIICYDTQKAAIKMVQRVGRTGRKKDGRVELLLTKDREEGNYTSALDAYKDVQQSIVKGTDLELYGDVKRLLPDHVRPECIEMMMEIIPYEREERTRSGPSSRQTSSKSRQTSIKFKTKSNADKPKASRKRSRIEEDAEDMDDSPSKRKKFIQSSSDDEDEDKEPMPKKGVSIPKRATSIPKSVPTGFQSARDLAMKVDNVLTSRASSSKVVTSSRPQGSKPPRQNSTFSKTGAPSRPQLNPKPVAEKNDMAWLMDSDSDSGPKPTIKKQKPVEDVIDLTDTEEENSDVDILDDIQVSPRRATVGIIPFKNGTAIHARDGRSSSPDSSPPIRQAGRKVSPIPAVEDLSEEVSPPMLRRLKRKDALIDKGRMPPPPVPLRLATANESPVRAPVRQSHGQRLVKRSILDRPEYLEVEAIHSGDEVEAGSSDSDGMENSSDREFVVDTSATQVSSDYDQSAIYRQGLFTQAPTGGPTFISGPVRTGYLGRGRGTALQNRFFPSSSPEKDEDLDKYSLGSFVVDDDDDVLADTSAEV